MCGSGTMARVAAPPSVASARKPPTTAANSASSRYSKPRWLNLGAVDVSTESRSAAIVGRRRFYPDRALPNLDGRRRLLARGRPDRVRRSTEGWLGFRPVHAGDWSERHRRPESGSHLIGQKPRGDRSVRMNACRSGGWNVRYLSFPQISLARCLGGGAGDRLVELVLGAYSLGTRRSWPSTTRIRRTSLRSGS